MLWFLYGDKCLYVDEMALDVTTTELTTALQGLPCITAVTVTDQVPSDGGREFTIAFNDDLGKNAEFPWTNNPGFITPQP